jgi:hypothetical protein
MLNKKKRLIFQKIIKKIRNINSSWCMSQNWCKDSYLEPYEKLVQKRANNDLQNITQKTKDRETRTPLKPGRMKSGSLELADPASQLPPVHTVG